MRYIIIFTLTLILEKTTETLRIVSKGESSSTGADDLDKKEHDEWNEETAIQEFPTNAIGEIHFINEDEGSIKPSK